MARGWGWNSKPEPEPERGTGVAAEDVEIVVPKNHPVSTHSTYQIENGQQVRPVSCYCKATSDHAR